MQESDEKVKNAAASALERLEIRAKLDMIGKMLAEGQKMDKLRGVYALANLRGPKVVELLVKAAKDDIEDVRASAIRALGSIADKAALHDLVEALKDESVIVERVVIETLSRFREPQLVGPLIHMLKSKDPGVIERALEVLASFADKRAEEAMMFFAAKGNSTMKCAAVRALGMMEP